MQAFQTAQKAQQALNAMTPAQMAANPQQVAQLQQIASGGGGTGITSNIASILGGGAGAGMGGGGGGGGGFLSGLGNFAKTAGIGALAAGLGKLAYEDAQKQTGVPLTPLTTLSPTGRYNIEAEIARRMGQEAPNPVEFGLLPAGTIPELSGGKPAGMQEGGGVDKMRALATRAEQANATINALENTFNPNNIRDLVASNLPFDPTAIENLLTSAEKKQIGS